MKKITLYHKDYIKKINAKDNDFYIIEGSDDKYNIDFIKNLISFRKNKHFCDFCECKDCISIKNNQYANMFVFNLEEKSIGINQIKEIKRNFKNTPLLDGTRFICINDADYLTLQASNSLLYTLENIFKNNIWILICRNINNILYTIRSRGKIINLKTNINNSGKIDLYEYIYLKLNIEKSEREKIFEALDVLNTYSSRVLKNRNFFCIDNIIEKYLKKYSNYNLLFIFLYYIEFVNINDSYEEKKYLNLFNLIKKNMNIYINIVKTLELAQYNLSYDILTSYFFLINNKKERY